MGIDHLLFTCIAYVIRAKQFHFKGIYRPHRLIKPEVNIVDNRTEGSVCVYTFLVAHYACMVAGYVFSVQFDSELFY